MNKRRVAILGSTGSIGRQALDVIRQHRDLVQVELRTANTASEPRIAQAREFDVNSAVICNEEKYDAVASALQKDGIKVFAGMDSVCSLVGGSNIDIVLTAMVGFSGLASTVAAIKAGKAIALANKETLVAAGSLVTALAREHGVPLLPVDSEHSAIFQCLQGCGNNRISRIHLTASGGPFREWSREKIAAAGPREALRHPNWQMGSKITIDSATMMNKGLEVIEAKWLFDVEPEDIRVVVHPESIIHSMVEFADGAVIAQLGHPDMREPIQYALAYPQRLNLDHPQLDVAAPRRLSVSAPATARFPALGLAYEALRRGGNLACTMNAANEIAVAAYLREEISFYGISDIVAETMAGVEFAASPSLDDIFATNEAAKEYASALIEKRKGRW